MKAGLPVVLMLILSALLHPLVSPPLLPCARFLLCPQPWGHPQLYPRLFQRAEPSCIQLPSSVGSHHRHPPSSRTFFGLRVLQVKSWGEPRQRLRLLCWRVEGCTTRGVKRVHLLR